MGEIVLGSTGVEQFQIMADNDDEKIYCPDRPNCGSKVETSSFCGVLLQMAQVQGPKTAGKALFG